MSNPPKRRRKRYFVLNHSGSAAKPEAEALKPECGMLAACHTLGT